jgi:transcriptional regulator with XRE-family HTH domain
LRSQNNVAIVEQTDRGGQSVQPTIDLGALYSALDSKRKGEGLSWRELARRLEASPSVFTRLAQGRRPELETYLAMVGWLGARAEDFVEGDKPSQAEAQETVAAISTYLRADRALKPESAEAIETIVRAAYAQMVDGDK